jgi:hypothetical protein
LAEKSGDRECILDLFGEPMIVRSGGPGRPEHVPTDRNRQKIVLLLAMGWPQKRIAGAIGLTVKTLRKHYSPQLKARDQALDRLKATQLNRLLDAVQAGNVGAIKELGRIITRIEVGVLDGQRAPEPKAKEPPKGLKDQRRDAAWSAGEKDSTWGELLTTTPRPN